MAYGKSRDGYQNFIKKYNAAVKSTPNTVSKSENPALNRQISAVSNLITTGERQGLTYTGDIPGVDFRNVVVKPKMPDWLYRPIYGRPRYINIPEIRRLMDTPTAGMCITTIVDEVCSIPWRIRMKNPEEREDEKRIDEVTERLLNPNRNNEDFRFILKKVVRDILGVDAGVIAKIYDRASYESGDINRRLLPLGRRKILEFYAFDGGTFTINPDEHGILPDQQAYYQYNFHHQSMPIPFARDEIIYMMSNPRTNNIYGVSPMEMAYDVVRYLVFGVTSGIDYFTNNQVPKGILSILDADIDHIQEFQARVEDKVTIQDPVTEELRWVSSKVPITNQDVKFTPLQLTPEVMNLLETQQWYVKLIFACFGVTPSELGFTEDSNRAVDIVQSEVFRRKAILPKLNLLEYYFNRELIPEFGYDDLLFEFIRKDIQTDLREQKLWESWLRNGQRTVNEWRMHYGGLEPVEWGDKPLKTGVFGSQLSGKPFGLERTSSEEAFNSE